MRAECASEKGGGVQGRIDMGKESGSERERKRERKRRVMMR